ncbi:MAG: hypothetical protein RR873_05215, partial [Christensenella sp.]
MKKLIAIITAAALLMTGTIAYAATPPLTRAAGEGGAPSGATAQYSSTVKLAPMGGRSVPANDISTYYSGTTDWTKSLVWFGNGNDAEGTTDPILFRTLDANTNEILMLSETLLGRGTMWQPQDQGGNYQGSTIQNTMTSLYTTKFQSQIGGWLKSVSYDNISTSGTKDAIYPLSYTEAGSTVWFPNNYTSRISGK